MTGSVIVTGCSTGIGRATAQQLAKSGWTVYATARRLESIADLEADGCKTLALDVTDVLGDTLVDKLSLWDVRRSNSEEVRRFYMAAPGRRRMLEAWLGADHG